jgi:leucyl-tRNA synthetase
MLEYLKEKGIGHEKVNYRLQDWIFSRQRFWGEPIPMIYCEKCGWQPVPEEELPLLLPDVAEYEPTEDGESPLANITDWVNCKCPKCGGDARRETDTMPNWAGSSWYFLRFMDPHNDKEFASMEAMRYWNKVDWYNGGMEHTARHLLYARFWVQFLYNIGLVPNKEMIWTRVSHGMILGSNNEKMSKSKGNVVNPDDIVKEYGADALRTYEMFIGDYEKDAAWSLNGLKGCKKFLDRIFRLGEKLNDSNDYSKETEILMNQTIKKVTEDLNSIKYNTAVSALMILLNELEKLDTVSKKDYRTILHLLNPIAPHITEELNEIYNLGEKFCLSSWLEYDNTKLENNTYTMVVQVNGKVRGKIEVDTNTTEDEMKKKAMQIENVKVFTEGKDIVKMIVVPKKLVNIVVK